MPAPGRPGPSVIPARLMSDEQLALAVEAGREAAFTTIFRRHHQQLYRYCRSLVGNDEDAQDALQTSLTNALLALRAGRRNAPLRPWLFRIAHNESLSLLRSRRAQVELPEELAAAGATPELVETRERFRTLIGDLQELAEAQRTALVLRELSGLSHEEIGEVLGISPGAAKQTILEARRSLQEFAEGRRWDCAHVQELLSAGDRRTLRGLRVKAHLRACPACSDFAQAISERRAQMLALWPVLPAAAATGLLTKLTGTASSHAGGGLGGVSASAAVKGLGASVPLKAAAVGLVAAAGLTTGALTVLHHSQAPPRPAPARALHTGQAGGSPASRGRSSSGPAPHSAAPTTVRVPAGPRQTRIRVRITGAGGHGQGVGSRGAGHGSHANPGPQGGSATASGQHGHAPQQPTSRPAGAGGAGAHGQQRPSAPSPAHVHTHTDHRHRPHRRRRTPTTHRAAGGRHGTTTQPTTPTPASGSQTSGGQGTNGHGSTTAAPGSNSNGKNGTSTP